MFQVDQEIFFQKPSESAKRVLHAGKVICVEGDLVTATFEEEQLGFEEDLEFLVYYEKKREFMKQPAKIQTVIEVDPEFDARSSMAFQTCGEPVSAESRQCYRASTVISKRKVSVGGEDHCPLLDVSIAGFAFIGKESYQIGQILDTVLTHEGKTFRGTTAVQTIRELPDGRIRYGMYCSDERSSDADLLEGLHVVSMAVQREQLKRLAGAG